MAHPARDGPKLSDSLVSERAELTAQLISHPAPSAHRSSACCLTAAVAFSSLAGCGFPRPTGQTPPRGGGQLGSRRLAAPPGLALSAQKVQRILAKHPPDGLEVSAKTRLSVRVG